MIKTAYEIATMGETTTIYEISNFLILSLLGSIVLLNPDEFFGIKGISQSGILREVPGWVALIAVLASPSWLLVTKYARWVNDRLSR